MPFLLLFIAVPIVEIALLIRVGGAIGLFPTLAIVILTAFVGTRMLRSQGRVTLERARRRLNGGEMPAGELVEGLLLLVGGVMLLTPGFVTDAFGFACLVPGSRRWLAERLSARSIGVVVGGFGQRGPGGVGDPAGTDRFDPSGSEGFGAPGASRASGSKGQEGAAPGGAGERSADVIEGDYRRVD